MGGTLLDVGVSIAAYANMDMDVRTDGTGDPNGMPGGMCEGCPGSPAAKGIYLAATIIDFTQAGAAAKKAFSFVGRALGRTKVGRALTSKATRLLGALPIPKPPRHLPSNVWTDVKPTERGKMIEANLAQTDYADWFNCGQLDRGYFPLVDFQKGDTLVSLKTVDTGGSRWMSDMQEHLQALGRGHLVDGKPANMVLDMRVDLGGAGAAAPLIEFGKRHGVTVRIGEYP